MLNALLVNSPALIPRKNLSIRRAFQIATAGGRELAPVATPLHQVGR
jgi:hypothetical protein